MQVFNDWTAITAYTKVTLISPSDIEYLLRKKKRVQSKGALYMVKGSTLILYVSLINK